MAKLTPFAKTFITVVILAVLAAATNHYLEGGLRGLFRQQASASPAPTQASPTDAKAPSGVDVSTAASAVRASVRLCGSNTIGAKLAPALVQAHLQGQGIAATVRRLGQDEVAVEGGGQAVSISAHGTKTGFEALAGGTCDIAMASRPIAADEARRLAGLGDMTSSASEHVIGLDGVAVIVHPANPLRHLDRAQIADVFSGRVADWSALGGAAAPIHVYVRDQNSGTTDTFKERVLRGAGFLAQAQSFESNTELASRVAGDPDAIGFVSFSETGSTRVLAVGEEGTLPVKPNRLTVGKEQYLLSRRLYLYTPASQSAAAAELVRFVVSDEGQGVVDRVGFVGQRVVPTLPDTSAGELTGAPAEYKAFITGAKTLPFSFRFQPGSALLDTKAEQDLERLVAFYQRNPETQILLFGFADASGSTQANQRLSQQRAAALADELRSEGIAAAVVRGFGATLFVDTNDTPEGRERNRRVEVWVR